MHLISGEEPPRSVRRLRTTTTRGSMGTMAFGTWALPSALLLAWVPPVVAQDALVGAFGLGWGKGTIACTMCPTQGTYDGMTIHFNLGKTENPHLRVLFDYDEWWHPATSGGGVSGSDWDKVTETFTASAQFFPWTIRRRFFLEGGLGLTVAKIWISDTSGLRRHGWGFTGGAGYDLFPGRSTSLTPRIAVSYGYIDRIYYPLGTHTPWADGWKHAIVSAGLDVAFHRRPT